MPAFEVANDAVQARAVRLFGAEQSSRLLDGQEYAAIAYSNKHGLLVYLAGDAVACASAAQLEAAQVEPREAGLLACVVAGAGVPPLDVRAQRPVLQRRAARHVRRVRSQA